MEDHAVAMALERAVQVTTQHLAVQESDGDLAGRRLRVELLVARQLDPFDRCQRDPGGLVVLQATGVVRLDEEVGLVKIEITRNSFKSLVVEEANDYLGHITPTVTLMSPHSCARGAARFDGRISYIPQCACAQPRPDCGEACRPGMAPAGERPRRG